MSTASRTPVLDLFRLEGKTALVTGASSGLGRSMALALAEAGADVLAVGLDDLDQVAQEVRDLGVDCSTHETDLSVLTPDTAARLISWARDELAQPTILVNNAGIIRRGPALETSPSDWSAVLDVNLTAPFLLSQAFARGILAAGQAPASIINIASINAFQGGMEVPAYAASKHGLLGLTRALANEWTPHGIRVNAVAPGYMDTDFTRAHRENAERAQNMLRRIPANSWGRPEDLAGAVVFLASDAAAYVSGAALAIDGGWLSR
ncbi:SDR family oxidoreductase [Micrococcus sp. TA1]|uniref:SDR family oxidoreductase n=1 Tax=Micrococcus sp. TA1 TaxID=681627 RepID=UPI001610338B|nr:SDR family oxidoreductase [Micrococcus sp. TA1]MBB5750290.1 2-deoxy-D-gluconate 3-dehydrogenase [Micrococcus sp. TA1]